MKLSPYNFFMRHAGYSYDPKTETKLQGRQRCAKSMAADEKAARDGGFSYRWSIDQDASSADWIDASDDYNSGHSDPWQVWQCAMYNADGRIVASLHSIDFGRDGSPWSDPYRRVVEAEIASDGLTNAPQGKACEVQS